ncbi:MAG: acyl-ACP--UDP-N-acetylglucosamine O-acyltransferase [Deltaproteobacteria bacterium]|nr:acyl-ACP--UDP-N-acetylglucosamine O-acyltransferase [Deltaproteobacteria bacterium]
MRQTGVTIHPSAVVAPGAELDSGVEIGPYAVLGPQVRIGKNTWIGPHAVIEGRTMIGCENRIFQFASVGAIPQDKKYRDEESVLIIGDHNVIREFATLNPGTAGGGMVTRVGNYNLFMVYSHVAHDCLIGNHVVLANSATLGGHVTLEDYVGVGGLVGIHQFTRIGESAYLGAGSMVSLDVPPYCTAVGDRAHLHGLNLIGLKRRGWSAEQLVAIKKAYRTLFSEGLPLKEALVAIRSAYPSSPEVAHMTDFIAASTRGICRPRGNGDPEGEEELV